MVFCGLENTFYFTILIFVLLEEVICNGDAGLERVLKVLEYRGFCRSVLGLKDVFVVLEDVGVHF